MGSIFALAICCLLLLSNSASAELIKKTTPVSKNPPPSQQEEAEENKEKPLDFSDTGRPGQQTAGESRSGCNSLHRPLQALLPVSHSGKTVDAHPSFWVYFPYNSKYISHVEFVVQDEDRQDIWRSQSQINTVTGYQSFSLPTTVDPLEVGQWYRWYVKVYCQSETASAQYIQGWIERIPLSSQLYIKLEDEPQQAHQVYGKAGIWYDAIDSLLDFYHLQPSNLSLEKDWQNFLNAKGVRLNKLPSIGSTFEAVNSK